MRAYGAAVVHLSPHAVGRARGRRRQRGRHRRDGRRARRARPSPDRVPGRSAVAVRRARAPGRLSAGARRRRHRVRRAPRRRRPGVRPRGRRARRRHAPRRARPSSPRSRARTTCWRSARSSGSAELGIDVPGEVSVAGFDDIQTAALTAPRLSTVRLPLREIGRRGFEHAARVLDGGAAGADRVVLRGTAGSGPARTSPPGAGGPLMGDALAGRVVLVTGSSRGIGAEVAAKAAAEGATVAVHYHRSPGGRRRDARARARGRRRRGVLRRRRQRRRRRPRAWWPP